MRTGWILSFTELSKRGKSVMPKWWISKRKFHVWGGVFFLFMFFLRFEILVNPKFKSRQSLNKIHHERIGKIFEEKSHGATRSGFFERDLIEMTDRNLQTLILRRLLEKTHTRTRGIPKEPHKNCYHIFLARLPFGISKTVAFTGTILSFHRRFLCTKKPHLPSPSERHRKPGKWRAKQKNVPDIKHIWKKRSKSWGLPAATHFGKESLTGVW